MASYQKSPDPFITLTKLKNAVHYQLRKSGSIIIYSDVTKKHKQGEMYCP